MLPDALCQITGYACVNYCIVIVRENVYITTPFHLIFSFVSFFIHYGKWNKKFHLEVSATFMRLLRPALLEVMLYIYQKAVHVPTFNLFSREAGLAMTVTMRVWGGDFRA